MEWLTSIIYTLIGVAIGGALGFYFTKKRFEKELKELTTLFAIEFRKNNVEQRKKYNELMNK